MSEKSKKESPFAIVIRTMENIAQYVRVNGHRLGRIEDRLAELDGGPDASKARTNAHDEVNAEMRKAGQPALTIPRSER